MEQKFFLCSAWENLSEQTWNNFSDFKNENEKNNKKICLFPFAIPCFQQNYRSNQIAGSNFYQTLKEEFDVFNGTNDLRVYAAWNFDCHQNQNNNT